MINSIIAQYRVLRLIGEGGMASVYEAEHDTIKKKVAIKVLNPYLSGNAQFRERFKKEAELMAKLKNQNITEVFDYDEHPVSYIIMEYLEGEDLRERIIRKGRLDDEEIKTLFTQILSAFQYAHENGIVHRDIKPSNIFILKNGQVKILDFGIAKIFGQGDEFTQTGTQMGTTVYMSPEQVKADRSIDFRSDIYSLGITMYYAINGKAPYDTENISQFDIFNKIVHETLPKSGYDSIYYETILRACEKGREERYQSCNEWLLDIENISSGRVDKTRIKKKKATSSSAQKVILSILLNNIEVIGIIASLFSFFASVILFISAVLEDQNEYIRHIGEWFNVALFLGLTLNFTAVIYYLVNKTRFYSPAIFLLVAALSFFIEAGYFYSFVDSLVK